MAEIVRLSVRPWPARCWRSLGQTVVGYHAFRRVGLGRWDALVLAWRSTAILRWRHIPGVPRG